MVIYLDQSPDAARRVLANGLSEFGGFGDDPCGSSFGELINQPDFVELLGGKAAAFHGDGPNERGLARLLLENGSEAMRERRSKVDL